MALIVHDILHGSSAHQLGSIQVPQRLPRTTSALQPVLEYSTQYMGLGAHAHALLQRGDLLQAIDGVDVFKRPAQEVSGLLLGARDTSVRVSLFRELVGRPRFTAHARSGALPPFSLIAR